MRRMIVVGLVMLLLLSIAPAITVAQEDDDTCPALVDVAIQSAAAACSDTGRNQACYGNVQIDATPREGVSEFEFEQIGDIVDITNVQSLILNGMDVTTQEWGVAIMQIQANLPDTLPGQNVTFVLFGDVQIEDASDQVEGGFGPMQAIYLSTGVGDSACNEAPNSGVMVQTPEGVAEVMLNVNGVDIALGSTAFLQAEEPEDDVPGELRVSLLEGTSTITANETSRTLEPGQWSITEFDADFAPVGEPSEPEPEVMENIMSLPTSLLIREIELPEVSAGSMGGPGAIDLDIVPVSGVWGLSDFQMTAGEGCPAEMAQAFEMASSMGLVDVSATFDMDWEAIFSGEIENSGRLMDLSMPGMDEGMLGPMMGELDTTGPVPDYTFEREDGALTMRVSIEGMTLDYRFVIESETRVSMTVNMDAGMGCPLTISAVYEYQG